MRLLNEIKQEAIEKNHPHLWHIISNNYFRALAYPIILLILLILLSASGTSGSSIGIYHQIFYGATTDTNLIANSPRSIRSDEWILGSQRIIAQENNDYKAVNQNIGEGEDTILLTDVPAKDWSTLFRPHNIGFFILPFENAFALRWWMPTFLLALAVYVFSLSLLPRKYFISSLISIIAVASPFLHWWYGYSTFAILAFAFLGLASVIHLLKTDRIPRIFLLSIATIYCSVAFVFSFYPPFQIPIVLVVTMFIVGYYLENRNKINGKKTKILVIITSIFIAICLSGFFFLQHKEALSVVATTAYPGERIVPSGGYSMSHFLSSAYSPIFQNDDKAKFYKKPSIGAVNSSESANFILLMPLLIPVLVYFVASRNHSKERSWTLIMMLFVSLLFLVWLFIPQLSIIGKITLLDKVPHSRLLMGWGLINLILLIVFIRDFTKKQRAFPRKFATIYSLLMYVLYLILGWRIHQQFPDFLGVAGVFIYGAIFPIIIFLLMRRRFILALTLLAMFSVYSVASINPLYKGVGTITETPIAKQIKQINNAHPGTWVSDSMQIENFPVMVGARSLVGTFVIPQNSLWDKLGIINQRDAYNRYAHVGYTFDRLANVNTPTRIVQNSPDQFNIFIEPCNSFFTVEDVKYVITTEQFTKMEAPCMQLISTAKYPNINFYIYHIDS